MGSINSTFDVRQRPFDSELPNTSRQVLIGLWYVSLIYSLLLIAYSLFVTPQMLDSGFPGWVPECPVHASGGHCLACGLTHSIAAIGHGEISAGIANNILGMPIYLIAATNLLYGASVFLLLLFKKIFPGR